MNICQYREHFDIFVECRVMPANQLQKKEVQHKNTTIIHYNLTTQLQEQELYHDPT